MMNILTMPSSQKKVYKNYINFMKMNIKNGFN